MNIHHDALRAAIYARVSTADQTRNQLAEIHRYVAARGWNAQDYIDPRCRG